MIIIHAVNESQPVSQTCRNGTLKRMDEAALRPYREYHARRERELRQEREALRLAVLEKTREAVRRSAPLFPAIRAVYLLLQVVLRRALELKPLYRSQIERFLAFFPGIG